MITDPREIEARLRILGLTSPADPQTITKKYKTLLKHFTQIIENQSTSQNRDVAIIEREKIVTAYRFLYPLVVNPLPLSEIVTVSDLQDKPMEEDADTLENEKEKLEEEVPVPPSPEEDNVSTQARPFDPRPSIPYPSLSSVGRIERLFGTVNNEQAYPSLPTKTKRENLFEPMGPDVYPKAAVTKEKIYADEKKPLPKQFQNQEEQKFPKRPTRSVPNRAAFHKAAPGFDEVLNLKSNLDAIKKSKPQLIANYLQSTDPLVRAIMTKCSTEAFVQLVNQNEDLALRHEENDTLGNTLAHIAVLVGRIDLVEYLSNGYCDLNQKNKQGMSVLEYSMVMNDEKESDCTLELMKFASRTGRMSFT